MYPILCVAVSRANDASRLLHHLEDDASVDVAHNVGVVWAHESAGQKRLFFKPVAIFRVADRKQEEDKQGRS